MALIDPQEAVDAAQPWCCIPQGDLWYGVLAALTAVGNGDPMPTAQELMDDIACLKCSIQSGDVPLLIIGAVSSITAGGGGTGGVTCGAADPVAAPANACTLYYRTDNGSLWKWNGAAWEALLGP